MSRRSTPRRTIDDMAMPIRLKVRVPAGALGGLLTDMLLWLSAEVGPGDYAQHPVDTLGGDAIAVHFRRAEGLACAIETWEVSFREAVEPNSGADVPGTVPIPEQSCQLPTSRLPIA